MPIHQQTPERLLQGSMCPLRLPISLWVVGRGEHSLGPHTCPQLTPEVCCKPCIPVMHDFIWQTKLPYNLIEKHAGHSCSRQLPRPKLAWCQPNRLSEPIHTRVDGIKPTPTLRQIGYEIHGPTTKSSLGNGKGFQQALWGLSAVLRALTYLALRVRLPTSIPEPGPPYSGAQQLGHLFGAKVGCQSTAMGFVQEQLPTNSRHH